MLVQVNWSRRYSQPQWFQEMITRWFQYLGQYEKSWTQIFNHDPIPKGVKSISHLMEHTREGGGLSLSHGKLLLPINSHLLQGGGQLLTTWKLRHMPEMGGSNIGDGWPWPSGAEHWPTSTALLCLKLAEIPQISLQDCSRSPHRYM